MAYWRLNLAGIDMMLHVPRGLVRRLLPGSAAKMSERPPRRAPDDNAALAERVQSIEWYHTLDLGGGVVTDGGFDHRALLHHYPLPARLDGKRVLDVATFDGFWAFEMERRGAAEVVAIDIDSFAAVDMCPRIRATKSEQELARRTGDGFRMAREALGSKVRREVLNVYELSPERLGRFDVVVLSDLLLHLSHPTRALQNVASVTAGMAIIANPYNRGLPGRLMSYESGEQHNTWWEMSLGALEQMVHDAGFKRVQRCADVPLGTAAHPSRHAKAVFVGHND